MVFTKFHSLSDKGKAVRVEGIWFSTMGEWSLVNVTELLHGY